MSLTIELSLLRLSTPDQYSSCAFYCELSHGLKSFTLSKSTIPIRLQVSHLGDQVHLCLRSTECKIGQTSLGYSDLQSMDSMIISLKSQKSNLPEAKISVKKISQSHLDSPECEEIPEEDPLIMLNKMINDFYSEPVEIPVIKHKSPSKLANEHHQFQVKSFRRKIEELTKAKTNLCEQLNQEKHRNSLLESEIAELKMEYNQKCIQLSQSSDTFIEKSIVKIEEISAFIHKFESENNTSSKDNMATEDAKEKLIDSFSKKEESFLLEINQLKLDNFNMRNDLKAKESQLTLANEEIKRLALQLEESQELTKKLEESFSKKCIQEIELNKEKSLLGIENENLKIKIKSLSASVLKSNFLEDLESMVTHKHSLLQSEFESLKEENTRLSQEAVNSYEKIHSLECELSQFTLINSNLSIENNKHLLATSSLNQTISQLNALLTIEKAKNSSLLEQIQILSNMVVLQTAKSNGNSPSKYTPVREDPVDLALAKYLNDLNEPLDLPFVRETSGVYCYGSKRVFVKIEQGKIILRVGGGYMRIEEFIRLFTSAELDKIKTGRLRKGSTHYN